MENAVRLDKDRCKGCTTCIKQCPTEAIRVRQGKAHILKERCIDCGQCIRVCPYHAKKAAYDSLERLSDFKYTVALPAPSLYGQFRNMDDINIILAGLLKIGFDHVYEVSRGAEMISDLTRNMLSEKNNVTPQISSACPAAVRLICMRFPKLIENIAKHVAPMEIAAIHARADAVAETGLKPEEIGIFFISPCPAKVTAVHTHQNLNQSVVDGALSMTDIYVKLLGVMSDIKEPPQLAESGIVGVGWARSGGEASALLHEKNLAVDGIENIIGVLEDVEDDKLPMVEYLELNACNQGCVGGCLTVENPYVAKAQLKHLMKYMPVSRNKLDPEDLEQEKILSDKLFENNSAWKLDDDRNRALEKFKKISGLEKTFPGLDCGSCGAPSCRALAEDVILGFASEEDCIFRMRERVQYMTGTGDADEYLPPPFRHNDLSSKREGKE